MRIKQVRLGLSKTRSPCRPWISACSHVSVLRASHFISLNQLLRLNNPTSEWVQNLAGGKLVPTRSFVNFFQISWSFFSNKNQLWKKLYSSPLLFLVEDDAFQRGLWKSKYLLLPKILFSPNSPFDPIYQYSVCQVNRFGIHPDNPIDFIRQWSLSMTGVGAEDSFSKQEKGFKPHGQNVW